MKRVLLSNSSGDVKRRYVGFSFGFAFFGPLYLIFRLRIVFAIILLILYYYFLPIPGLDSLCMIVKELIGSNSVFDNIANVLLFFRGPITKYIGISIVVIFQLSISFFLEGLLLRKLIKKKKYLPVTEDDARLLISVHAASRKVLLAGSSYERTIDDEHQYLRKIDVPYIIDNANTTQVEKYKENEKRKKIDELNDIYRLGQINREEYEIRRARIMNTYK